MIKRALISTYDKAGIVDFAKGLDALGVQIISTGGTARELNAAGIRTLEVQDVTGFPECLDGRVKTLHPKIHGGLLAVRSNESHMEQMREQGVGMIDLIVSNLYPFKKTIEKPGVPFAEVIENIDIGGPAMLRSAAKNHRDVAVVVDPADYGKVLAALQTGGEVPYALKFELARKAFGHTANYDAMIADYLAKNPPAAEFEGGLSGQGAEAAQQPEKTAFPDKLTLTYEKAQQLRYGENPHQAAAFYAEPVPPAGSLATYAQLHGPELSYNNIGDLDGAFSLLAEFDAPAAVAIKHANPCGAAVGGSVREAYQKAYESDTESIFGGIVALNRRLDPGTASEIAKIHLDIVAAPEFDDGALKILMKKKNMRLITADLAKAAAARNAETVFVKKVGGGLLVQTGDNTVLDTGCLKTLTEKAPTDKELEDLIFAMAVVKHVKSNAIVLAKGGATVGVGPGQSSRIMSAKIAIEIAGGRSAASVAASDAFFPYDDCVEAFAAAGVSAIIQPGGSKNDQMSIDACNRFGIAMVATGIRHFKH